MSIKERQEELRKLLFLRFNTLILSRKQTAEALGMSTATLDRLRQQGLGPNYKKMGDHGKNGMVKYPIDSVVEYITYGQVATA